MSKLSTRALLLCVALAVGATAFADDKVAPVPLDRDKIAGIGLTAIPPDAFKDILESGELKMRVATLFEGKELRVEIFESTPARTNHRKRPTEGDEFVYVLSGKLILTEPNGTSHQYYPGDSPPGRLHRDVGDAGKLPGDCYRGQEEPLDVPTSSPAAQTRTMRFPSRDHAHPEPLTWARSAGCPRRWRWSRPDTVCHSR